MPSPGTAWAQADAEFSQQLLVAFTVVHLAPGFVDQFFGLEVPHKVVIAGT